MLLSDAFIRIRLSAITSLLLLLLPHQAFCQETVLDSQFTFRSGAVKTGTALDIISEKTGYSFTYDSRLINSEKKISLDYRETRLREILKDIVQDDSLVFSVIDRYIIISKPVIPSLHLRDTLPHEPNSVTGIIIDEETGEPLPFATIGLKNMARGTVTNNNGEFGLNLAPDTYSDTLSVSYLGYVGREIPVSQAAGNNLAISMKREYISIPEIIIRNQIPQEILIKARRAIPENFGKTPAIMTGFYREGVLRKVDLQNYSEAVLNIYKSSYSGSLQSDQIRIFKSRKLENIDRSDTLAVRLKAGLSTCLELDGARNLFDFLAAGSMEDYKFRLTDIVTYDDESAYAIEFEPGEFSDIPLFRGTIYINTSDFGIYNAEFEISPKQINKIKESFITSSSGGFNTWPVSVKYSVSYRKVNDRYFLSHVRGDLLFLSRQKRKLFNTQFRVFFELAVTDIRLENVKRFEREELAPIHSIFSKTINNYDPGFWANQDFLRPEENLIQALKNMKVKLQEFSE